MSQVQRIALTMIFTLMLGCKPHEIRFINEPCLVPYKRFDFKLCRDFSVLVNRNIYHVPKDFVTDLASIPRPLWSLFPPHDSQTIGAAILHDYLYRFNVGVTRKQADEIFYNALLYGQAGKYTALKFYAAVRLFGWLHYQKG
jgi:hypothetical protein